MAILSECPVCHRKQSVRNKLCPCGNDLDKAKRSRRVKYWVSFRLPGGKQKAECVGFSIEDAKAREREVLDQREKNPSALLVNRKLTFNELGEWYVGLKPVQNLAYFMTLSSYMKKFLLSFGTRTVMSLKPADLENLQVKRREDGYADATIDQEIAVVRAMLNKAFDNDLVDVGIINVFKKVKKTLKPNGNARDRILSPEEFQALLSHSPTRFTRDIITTGYYTGMREGEILNLTWDKVDLKARAIRLEASDTKDRERREIPICEELYRTLKAIPRSLHDQHEHVFQYNERPVVNIRKRLKKACKDANIPYGRSTKEGFVFHDLRHTFNTNMRKAGVAESVIMKITGHSTRQMFDRYNTVDQDDLNNAVDRMTYFLRCVDQNVDQTTARP